MGGSLTYHLSNWKARWIEIRKTMAIDAQVIWCSALAIEWGNATFAAPVMASRPKLT
jgi:hypothetical protein